MHMHAFPRLIRTHAAAHAYACLPTIDKNTCGCPAHVMGLSVNWLVQVGSISAKQGQPAKVQRPGSKQAAAGSGKKASRGEATPGQKQQQQAVGGKGLKRKAGTAPPRPDAANARPNKKRA